jgi:uncharacterized membrane protein
MEEKKTTKVSLGKKLRNQFMAGLLVMVPLGATILILVWLFNSIDHILQPIINRIFDRDIAGVGFGVTIILIYLMGVIATNVIGHRIIKWGDSLLDRVPIFRLVYRSLRQILASFSVSNNTFMQVVMVDFPHKGMKAMAFVTNEIIGRDGKKNYTVLIPTAPNPTTGFMQIVREEDVTTTKISVDEAIKMIVSAGKVMPAEVCDRLPCSEDRN